MKAAVQWEIQPEGPGRYNWGGEASGVSSKKLTKTKMCGEAERTFFG